MKNMNFSVLPTFVCLNNIVTTHISLIFIIYYSVNLTIIRMFRELGEVLSEK